MNAPISSFASGERDRWKTSPPNPGGALPPKHFRISLSLFHTSLLPIGRDIHEIAGSVVLQNRRGSFVFTCLEVFCGVGKAPGILIPTERFWGRGTELISVITYGQGVLEEASPSTERLTLENILRADSIVFRRVECSDDRPRNGPGNPCIKLYGNLALDISSLVSEKRGSWYSEHVLIDLDSDNVTPVTLLELSPFMCSLFKGSSFPMSRNSFATLNLNVSNGSWQNLLVDCDPTSSSSSPFWLSSHLSFPESSGPAQPDPSNVALSPRLEKKSLAKTSASKDISSVLLATGASGGLVQKASMALLGGVWPLCSCGDGVASNTMIASLSLQQGELFLKSEEEKTICRERRACYPTGNVCILSLEFTCFSTSSMLASNPTIRGRDRAFLIGTALPPCRHVLAKC